MVGGRDVVQVLNSSAFHDTRLVCSGDLAYLGGSWSKNVSSAVSSPLFSLSPSLQHTHPHLKFIFISFLICLGSIIYACKNNINADIFNVVCCLISVMICL